MRNSAEQEIPSDWPLEPADFDFARPIPSDDREETVLDLRSHGGPYWIVQPRAGYASCRVLDGETRAFLFGCTMKQVLRELYRRVPHRLGARNLQ